MEILDNILVVKVGTSTLVRNNGEREELNIDAFVQIGDQVERQRQLGKHVVLVTSGSITAGMIQTNTKDRPDKGTEMPKLQRLAAIGWPIIARTWDNALNVNTNTASVLVTRRELTYGIERDELLKVTYESLASGDVVLVNENDTISHDEIKLGDNDVLAARFAATIGESSLFGANIELVLLTDVDGLYRDPSDPRTLVSQVGNIHDFYSVASDSTYQNGTGGMKTKLDAAVIARSHYVDMWLTNGAHPNAIEGALSGQIGTYFPHAT